MLRKPNPPKVYVLKHAHNNCLFLSTQLDGKTSPCVVGFILKSKAESIRTLMLNKVKVEPFEIERISRLCHTSYLHFAIFKDGGEIDTYPYPEKEVDIDQARFLLETSFRYY